MGTVLHAGRTMLTAEAKVTDLAGKLYAHGTGTFLVYPNG
jgi:acyl-CoA thioesterase